jgi:glycosyltransferase involved in cell wall biosynthesis
LIREFPEYDIHQLKSVSNKYAFMTFVINEGDRIRKQLLEMSKYSDIIDVIIADGGSTDGSLDIDYLKSCNVTSLLTKKGEGKLSAQMRMGFDYVLNMKYNGVVVVDGNGKDDVSGVLRFITALEDGFDHIQGSRYIPGGSAINTPLMRHLGLKLLHAPLISLASRFRYTDTTNGFRAYSSRLLLDPQINVFRNIFKTYELHYYLAIQAVKKGYKVTEVPVSREYPKSGATVTKISPLKGNLQILKILFSAVLGKYDFKNDQ